MSRLIILIVALIGLALINCEQGLEIGEKSCAQEFDFVGTNPEYINVTLQPEFTSNGDYIKLHANGTNFDFTKPFGWVWFENFNPERLEIYSIDSDPITSLKIETDLQFKKGGYYVIINDMKQASLVEIYPDKCNDLITYE